MVSLIILPTPFGFIICYLVYLLLVYLLFVYLLFDLGLVIYLLNRFMAEHFAFCGYSTSFNASRPSSPVRIFTTFSTS